MSEKMLLQKYGVTVTSARAIFIGNTYPIGGITAVGKRRIRRNNEIAHAFGFMYIFSGGLITIMSVVGSTFAFLIMSLPLLILGACIFIYANRLPIIYAVTISTAGGQVQVFRSLDVDRVQEIHDAIVAAVIAKS